MDHDPRQQSLLPGADQRESERLAMVRGALAKLKLWASIAEEVERLILLLDAWDRDKTGCAAFLDTLADRLNRPVRTVQRRLALCREHGLVKSWWHRGRPRNLVRW